MKVNKVPSSFASTLKKFNKGEESSPNTSQQFEQSNKEDVAPDINMSKVHLDEVDNIQKYLEEVMNTKLIFQCVWLESESVHNLYFLDADTNDVLLRMSIPAFRKMVDSFVLARTEGQILNNKGNFLSIKV